MIRRYLPAVALFVLLATLAGPVQARPVDQPQPTALVYVAVGSEADRAGFEKSGLPAYTRPLEGHLLSGADPAGLDALRRAGLSFRILDPDISDMLAGRSAERLYVAFPMPGRPAPRWEAYGRLLLEEYGQVLLRATPTAAERLTMAGVELRALTFDPKPLAPAPEAGILPEVITPDPLIQQMIDQVTLSTVYQYTGDLSGEWPVNIGGSPYTIYTRNTYSGTPIQKATQYVGEHLTGLGLAVEYHQWGGSTYPNVIGTITGTINPDDMPSYGNAPGADDNASGSVATLIAADILSQYDWGCTLRFAFWTGEEQGLNGSHAYAQRAYNRGENILGYLNLDMIAWNTGGSSPDIDLHADSTLPPTLVLAQLFADVVDAYDLNLIPQIIPNGTGASDHASFWDYGYTAILGIEDMSDFNPYYHTVNDDMDNFQDWPYYVEFVKAAIGTYAHMSGCLIPGGIGYLDGHVTAAQGGAPIAGATVRAADPAGHVFSAQTSPSGYYTRTLLAGTYVVTATAYGYLPASVSGVVITTDTVTTADFALQTAPRYVVSGTVSEAGTGLPLFAQIAFEGSPEVAWSDPGTGFYAIALPVGAYTMHVSAYGHRPQERGIVVDHNQTQDFSLEPLPCILLVDDDNNSPDTRPYFTAALDTLGHEYDIFDVGSGGGNGPTLAGLQGYSVVIWFSGDKYGSSAGPNATDEANLAAYLDGGGHLFLSSQDYLYDFGLTPFGQNYLGIGSYTSDNGDATSKVGVAGDPIGDGLGPYPLTYPSGFTDYGDTVNAAAPPASQAFRGGNNNRNLDVDKDGGAWRTVFFGTDWVPIYYNNAANGRQVLQRIIDWFGGCQPQIGWLVGTVTDGSSGQPLEGAQVTVAPGGHIDIPTDPGGHYTFTLPAGTYAVTAQMSGYYPQTVTGVVVQAGLTTTQDFALVPEVTVPILALSPGALSVTLVPGAQHTATLTVGNVGSAVLHFTLTEAPEVPWLAEEPTGGSVEPGNSLPVAVSFDTAGLTPGLYLTTLQVHTNDPLNPLVPVAVTLTVVVPEAPVASFISNAPVCLGEAAVFTDTSDLGQPPADDFLWHFGDGITSTLENPTHLYAAPGTYSVTLQVCNVVGCDTAAAWVEVRSLPEAGFTYAVGELTVTYTDTSQNATAWLWAFGDGITSTLPNPVHTYASAGTYTVTQWAFNGCGADIYQDQVTVGLAPEASFLATSPVCLGEATYFTNTTTGTPPISYLWGFGDGITSTLPNPVHTYGAAGIWDVTLEAENAFGLGQATGQVEVLALPQAAFTYTINRLEVTFTNLSQGTDTYLWAFGDGITATVANPVHTYATAGTYTVTLAAIGTCGQDTATARLTVPPEQPIWRIYLPVVWR